MNLGFDCLAYAFVGLFIGFCGGTLFWLGIAAWLDRKRRIYGPQHHSAPPSKPESDMCYGWAKRT
jgi:hypothetical protein